MNSSLCRLGLEVSLQFNRHLMHPPAMETKKIVPTGLDLKRAAEIICGQQRMRIKVIHPFQSFRFLHAFLSFFPSFLLSFFPSFLLSFFPSFLLFRARRHSVSAASSFSLPLSPKKKRNIRQPAHPSPYAQNLSINRHELAESKNPAYPPHKARHPYLPRASCRIS